MGRRHAHEGDARENELQGLGLTRYQATAYVTLHELGVARPKQVADSGEIPLARAYEALDDLVGLRLAEPVEGREKRYRALPVDAALDREIQRVGEGISSLAAHRDDLTAEFAPRADATTAASVLMHPGTSRFASALGEAMRGVERASGVILWATAKHALGGVRGIPSRPWQGLVILATASEVAEIAPLAETDLDVRILPARPWAVERVVAGSRLFLRLPSEAAAAGVALETSEAGFVADALAFVREAHARAVPLREALHDPAAALAAVEDLTLGGVRAREFLTELAATAKKEVLLALPDGDDTALKAIVAALLERPGIGIRVLSRSPVADVLPAGAARVVEALPFAGAVSPEGLVCEVLPGGAWRLSSSAAKAEAFTAAFDRAWREAGGAPDALAWGAEAFFERWMETLATWDAEALLVVGPGEAAVATPFISLFLDPHAPGTRRLRVLAHADDAARHDLAARGAEVRTTTSPFVSGGVLAGDRALLWPSPLAPANPVSIATKDPEVVDNFRVAFERSWEVADQGKSQVVPVVETRKVAVGKRRER